MAQGPCDQEMSRLERFDHQKLITAGWLGIEGELWCKQQPSIPVRKGATFLLVISLTLTLPGFPAVCAGLTPNLPYT